VQSGLPSSLWAEAASYVVYTKNRSPHRAINNVPERLWCGKAPGVAHLRPFGCRAWKYVAEPHQRAVKLAPRGLACIFVGYSADHMAYRLWDPSACKVELAGNVQFVENVFPTAGDNSDAQELSFNMTSFPGLECIASAPQDLQLLCALPYSAYTASFTLPCSRNALVV
jgi:hypothetical protein